MKNIGEIRMLAAVMFTDMVGYTAMMQKNEQKAFKLRTRQREVIDDILLKHQGKVLQYYGDGTLSIFGSAIEAVRSAREIQIELQNEPEVPMRIGIHMGDIVYNDEGVYGDSVNISARLQALGVPGSVLFSGKINDEIINHPDLKTDYLGSYTLKNITQEVQVFALKDDKLYTPGREELKIGREQQLRSIAVMPFVNMSPDKENEYFSDGMTEEILNVLTRIEGLKVTSRTSSFALKGKNIDAREIGRQLDVKTILEGSVRKHGNRVRITAQLISTADGFHVWSETFDSELENIFEVQDEISRKIANRLRTKLSLDKKDENLVVKSTENMDAYNHYLKGIYYWNKWTPGDIEEAVKYFQKAIELEPDFPQPYARIAGCYAFLGSGGKLKPEIASAEVEKYLELGKKKKVADPYIHITEAMYSLFYTWDMKRAKESLDKAKEDISGLAELYFYYTLYYVVNQEFSKALETALKGRELDPLSLLINVTLAEVYFYLGKFEEAERHFKQALDLDSGFKSAYKGLGWLYCFVGKYEKALEYFNRGSKLVEGDKYDIGIIGYTYAKMGNIEKAEECLKEMDRFIKEEETIQLDFEYALIHAALGNYDESYNYMESAIDKRLGGILFVTNPVWKELYSHPRMDELERKIKLIITPDGKP